jgi:hypothetical protein
MLNSFQQFKTMGIFLNTPWQTLLATKPYDHIMFAICVGSMWFSLKNLK